MFDTVYPTGEQPNLNPEKLNHLTTDSFNAGALAVIGEMRKFLDDIPEAYGWGKKDEEADRGYRICSKNVKAMGQKHLTTLEQALQDNK